MPSFAESPLTFTTLFLLFSSLPLHSFAGHSPKYLSSEMVNYSDDSTEHFDSLLLGEGEESGNGRANEMPAGTEQMVLEGTADEAEEDGGEAAAETETEGDGEGRDGEGREGEGRDGEGRDGEGRDGEGRDGEGRDGEGRDGERRDGERREGSKEEQIVGHTVRNGNENGSNIKPEKPKTETKNDGEDEVREAYRWLLHNVDEGTGNNGSNRTTTDGQERCHPKLDLVFLLDTSGPIEQLYREHVRWAVSLVESLPLERDTVRVAAVQYAGFPLTEFALGTYPSAEDIRQHLRRMKFQAGGTRTGYALRKAESELFRPDRGARADAGKIIVLFTDGLSVDDPQQPARQLREHKNVKIFIVSIFDDAPPFHIELNKISGKEENIFGPGPEELERLRAALLTEAERAQACIRIGDQLPFHGPISGHLDDRVTDADGTAEAERRAGRLAGGTKHPHGDKRKTNEQKKEEEKDEEERQDEGKRRKKERQDEGKRKEEERQDEGKRKEEERQDEGKRKEEERQDEGKRKQDERKRSEEERQDEGKRKEEEIQYEGKRKEEERQDEGKRKEEERQDEGKRKQDERKRSEEERQVEGKRNQDERKRSEEERQVERKRKEEERKDEGKRKEEERQDEGKRKEEDEEREEGKRDKEWERKKEAKRGKEEEIEKLDGHEKEEHTNDEEKDKVVKMIMRMKNGIGMSGKDENRTTEENEGERVQMKMKSEGRTNVVDTKPATEGMNVALKLNNFLREEKETDGKEEEEPKRKREEQKEKKKENKQGDDQKEETKRKRKEEMKSEEKDGERERNIKKEEEEEEVGRKDENAWKEDEREERKKATTTNGNLTFLAAEESKSLLLTSTTPSAFDDEERKQQKEERGDEAVREEAKADTENVKQQLQTAPEGTTAATTTAKVVILQRGGKAKVPGQWHRKGRTEDHHYLVLNGTQSTTAATASSNVEQNVTKQLSFSSTSAIYSLFPRGSSLSALSFSQSSPITNLTSFPTAPRRPMKKEDASEQLQSVDTDQLLKKGTNQSDAKNEAKNANGEKDEEDKLRKKEEEDERDEADVKLDGEEDEETDETGGDNDGFTHSENQTPFLEEEALATNEVIGHRNLSTESEKTDQKQNNRTEHQPQTDTLELKKGIGMTEEEADEEEEANKGITSIWGDNGSISLQGIAMAGQVTGTTPKSMTDNQEEAQQQVSTVTEPTANASLASSLSSAERGEDVFEVPAEKIDGIGGKRQTEKGADREQTAPTEETQTEQPQAATTAFWSSSNESMLSQNWSLPTAAAVSTESTASMSSTSLTALIIQQNASLPAEGKAKSEAIKSEKDEKRAKLERNKELLRKESRRRAFGVAAKQQTVHCPSLDVLFVVDSSGSVQRVYEEQKRWLEEILCQIQLEEPEKGPQVALIQFAGAELQKMEWGWNRFRNSEQMMVAFHQVRHLTGTTFIGRALQQAVHLLERRRRPVPALVVLLSDGFSQDDAVQNAQNLRSMANTQFYALSISELSNTEYLHRLTANPSHVFIGTTGADLLRAQLLRRIRCGV